MLPRLLFRIAFPLSLLAFAQSVNAETIGQTEGVGALQQQINATTSDGVLRLAAGVYPGPVVLNRPMQIACEAGAKIQGNGNGSVITLDAPETAVSGCEISGSGNSHETIDSGIQLTKKARGARVEGNHLTGNLYGVDVHGAQDAKVLRNTIIGRQDHRMNSRGNGVYVWNAPGAEVSYNKVRYGRDGIFTNTSKRNLFTHNTFRDLRFAVHYMYTQDSVVSDNVSIGNHLGYAIMFSKGVRVENNLSYNDRDQGIMLNYANAGTVMGNYIFGIKGRALFIYNAHKNTISGNRFEGNDIGIHFTAGSEKNTISDNAFIGNRQQVKYVGSKWVDWSAEGIGNYWSDHAAFDLDNDGFADTPYRPNDAIDHILWTQPSAKLLLGSPAVQLVRWAQRAFPATLPGGVIDRHPLVRPVEPKAMEAIQ
ncbi:nitrous oxide reductase family maturation protein NosD [Polycladidibacter hongkongensis]|uniref:nitrous oxide reductase family maturation protein NosD n=1 Tax=Polycladidibacter hongkongensis TaxID=1647556 RepID=UPI00082D9B0D|nr:nitrous oxide reductase family maturation protein NosD [Pseudovibrio hongkongensis]